MSNLTLNIEDELLKQARIYALQHDTSVNAMVRNFLASVVSGASEQARAERARAVEELDRLAREIEEGQLISTDWKWNREEVYEDRLARWNA